MKTVITMPTVNVSFGRGLFPFEVAAGVQWTVGMLRAAVLTEYDLNVSIRDRPRPPAGWKPALVNGKAFGFVTSYTSYNLGDYDETLPDDAELADGARVYLVTGPAEAAASGAADKAADADGAADE